MEVYLKDLYTVIYTRDHCRNIVLLCTVGLPFRSLASWPMLTCGNYVTFLAHTALTTSPGAQIARSLLR
jgi:hypothetical protein